MAGSDPVASRRFNKDVEDYNRENVAANKEREAVRVRIEDLQHEVETFNAAVETVNRDALAQRDLAQSYLEASRNLRDDYSRAPGHCGQAK